MSDDAGPLHAEHAAEWADRLVRHQRAGRRPGRAWSGPNKERIARLEAAGRMAPADARAVAEARASGA